jgi:hypothetical protein
MTGHADLSAPTRFTVPAGLTLLAQAHWPEQADVHLPAIPGFVESSFSPLIAVVADRCLSEHRAAAAAGGTARWQESDADATAIVLVTTHGDVGTAAAVAAAVDTGRRVPALLFFQSVPNSVLGHIAARWGLLGPIVCVCPGADPFVEAWSIVEPILAVGDAARALVIVADQGFGPTRLDEAVALLVSAAGTDRQWERNS